MKIHTLPNAREMGATAASLGSVVIRDAISESGAANIIVATGSSQFEVLAHLVNEPDIDWTRVTGFHLDEYLGLPITHPASFRGYLKERIVDQVPFDKFHYLDGEDNAAAECDRVGAILAEHPIDVAFIGIGENAHIAFNDPPADFETDKPYLIVDLDEACRRQQLGEGWFPTLDAVPTQAISMSVRQILKSKSIICSVPDERKADAVQKSVEGSVTPEVPASILQTHGDVQLILDQTAASRLAS